MQGYDLFYDEPTPLVVSKEQEVACDDVALRMLRGW